MSLAFERKSGEPSCFAAIRLAGAESLRAVPPPPPPREIASSFGVQRACSTDGRHTAGGGGRHAWAKRTSALALHKCGTLHDLAIFQLRPPLPTGCGTWPLPHTSPTRFSPHTACRHGSCAWVHNTRELGWSRACTTACVWARQEGKGPQERGLQGWESCHAKSQSLHPTPRRRGKKGPCAVESGRRLARRGRAQMGLTSGVAGCAGEPPSTVRSRSRTCAMSGRCSASNAVQSCTSSCGCSGWAGGSSGWGPGQVAEQGGLSAGGDG